MPAGRVRSLRTSRGLASLGAALLASVAVSLVWRKVSDIGFARRT